MSDQTYNELKNVGKITYQALEELKSIKCLMEKIASSNENIVKLLQSSQQNAPANSAIVQH